MVTSLMGFKERNDWLQSLHEFFIRRMAKIFVVVFLLSLLFSER